MTLPGSWRSTRRPGSEKPANQDGPRRARSFPIVEGHGFVSVQQGPAQPDLACLGCLASQEVHCRGSRAIPRHLPRQRIRLMAGESPAFCGLVGRRSRLCGRFGRVPGGRLCVYCGRKVPAGAACPQHGAPKSFDLMAHHCLMNPSASFLRATPLPILLLFHVPNSRMSIDGGFAQKGSTLDVNASLVPFRYQQGAWSNGSAWRGRSSRSVSVNLTVTELFPPSHRTLCTRLFESKEGLPRGCTIRCCSREKADGCVRE